MSLLMTLFHVSCLRIAVNDRTRAKWKKQSKKEISKNGKICCVHPQPSPLHPLTSHLRLQPQSPTNPQFSHSLSRAVPACLSPSPSSSAAESVFVTFFLTERRQRQKMGVIEETIAGGVGGTCSPAVALLRSLFSFVIVNHAIISSLPLRPHFPLVLLLLISLCYFSFSLSLSSSSFSGMCLVVVGHPLDTIKVRFQTMKVIPGHPPPYSGLMDCARQIVAADGVSGLYKGMLAPLVGVTPMYALVFLGYGVGKNIFWTDKTLEDLELTRIGLAGATSGLFSTPILAPLERLKCVLQIQNATAPKEGEKRFAGPMDLGKHIIKTEGVRSVFRGYMATNLRDSIASVGYFTTYEWLKRKLTPEGASGPSVAGTLFAGGMAGIMNWLPAIPIDTLKSRLQTAEAV